MAEIADEQRCKRSDGRGWRCRRPVAEGKSYCETHIQQAQLRQKRQPVPDYLKLDRAKRTPIVPKSEQESDGGDTDVNAPVQQGNKRKMTEAIGTSGDVSDVHRKRGKRVENEGSAGGNSDQLGGVSDVRLKRGKRVKKEGEGSVVVDLKLGRLEIPPGASSSSSQVMADSPVVKVGAPPAGCVLRRPKRSKNSEPIPVPVLKVLPSIKENIKAAKKKKIIKKCHWCGLRSFCVLIKCLACNKNFFCEECINTRYYCKKTVERQCPVCQGECPCRACTRGKPKQDKTKIQEPIIHDLEKDIIICDPEMEMDVSDHEKTYDFDIGQQLHIIQELLPVMTKLNEEKIIELDVEASNKGLCHDGVEVQIAEYTQKKECSFCKACIPDAHRSCDFCSFMLCLVCCHDLRDGYLHSSLENLKETRIVRSKSSKNTSWRFPLDGRISCPPKNLGGCKRGHLQLTSFYPFCLTKDLEESAKQILCSFQLKRLNGLSDHSPCLLCNGDGEAGLYIATKLEFKNNNLEHFMKHWGAGQAIVIRDVFQRQPALDWDFAFLLCEYLEKSAESRNTRSAKGARDWCEIELRRKQTFSGGLSHDNAWNEFLKFNLRFSSDFFQDHFPDHFNAVIQSLPVQEYMNPFMGFLNLGAYSPNQTKNPNLGSYVNIYYGGLDNPMDADLLSNLRVHACDMVNILVHASGHPISERKLNEVKMSMNRYNSHDHLKSSKKVANRNKLEAMLASTSKVDDTHCSDMDLTSSRLEDTSIHEVVLVSDESESESDDEEVSDADSCGARWDIFRREDVPMLLEYLKKYSDKLSRSYASPKKVVHPLFDGVFFLDDDHKMRLKEEFNVGALSFEQDIGEAVVIPAGCPYQMRKIKSCVNVVYEFLSPESALESIKVCEEVRLLPVNHKAKGTMVQVKEMAINRMQAAVEEMREVFVSQPEWSWRFVISHSAKPPIRSVYKGIQRYEPMSL